MITLKYADELTLNSLINNGLMDFEGRIQWQVYEYKAIRQFSVFIFIKNRVNTDELVAKISEALYEEGKKNDDNFIYKIKSTNFPVIPDRKKKGDCYNSREQKIQC